MGIIYHFDFYRVPYLQRRRLGERDPAPRAMLARIAALLAAPAAACAIDPAVYGRFFHNNAPMFEAMTHKVDADAKLRKFRRTLCDLTFPQISATFAKFRKMHRRFAK